MVKEIQTLREVHGWTQADLAKELGVNQSTISRIEAGHSASRPLEKLIRLLLDKAKVAA